MSRPADVQVSIYGQFGGPGHRIVFGLLPPFDQHRCDCAPPVRFGSDVEGEIASQWQRDGYSYVSWWDRQGDQRHGSHTGVLAPGTWTPQELVDMGRRAYPQAFRVTLGAWAGGAR